MGFANQVLGGAAALVRSAIKSPNFVAGATGWIVRKNGSAEFNNVTVRGGTIISGNSLTYSPSPGFGNLIESDTAVSGTDTYGNAYLAGRVTYSLAAGPEALQVTAYKVTHFSAASAAGPWTADSEVDFRAGYVNVLTGLRFGSNAIILQPSNDVTGATDGPLINTYLAAGLTVFLMPGTYYTNVVIQYPGGAQLIGPGPEAVTIIGVGSLAAVLASTGWAGSLNTTSQSPVRLSGFAVQASGTCTYGIVSQNFWSYFTDLLVKDATADGLRFDAFGANGTTVFGAAVTAVENHVRDCQFRLNSAAGFRTHDEIAHQHFTDGWFENCVVQGPGSSGTAAIVQIDVLAGWKVTGNHLYGAAVNAMSGQRLYNTRVENNYIEPWGTSATAGGYAGMSFDGIADDGFGGSVIADNTMNVDSTSPGNAASTIDGIFARVTSGNSGGLSVTGNVISNPEPVAAHYKAAFDLQTQSATATLNVVTTGNQVGSGWTAGVLLTANGGTINHTAGV